jgi:hypothetical protein
MLATSLVLLGCLLGAPWFIFFDVPTLFLVVLLPVAFLLQAHGMAGLKTTVQAVRCWLGPDNLPPARLGDAYCVVETVAKATINAAHICVLIGSIQILQSDLLGATDLVSDPEARLGPAMAVAILSYFYAICINFVFWGPLGRWLSQHAQASATDAQAYVADPTVQTTGALNWSA